MSDDAKAHFSRRRALAGCATAGLAIIQPALLRAQTKTQRVLTPSQTEGPFYPVRQPVDSDNDLVVVRGQEASAQGIVTHITGKVLDRDGRPVSGASVEIWQCDANGLYHHPRDRAGQRDGGFQGFGRTVVSAEGDYWFRTIRPVPYPGRTPHIHFRINTPARRLTTQMYVAGEPMNEADFIYRGLDRAERAAVTVALAPANGVELSALAGEFNIVI